MINKKTEDAIVEGYISNVKNTPEYVRMVLNSKESKPFTWNFTLPLKIDNKGCLKKDSEKSILDDLRCSFGLDLTKDIKITDGDIEKEKQNIKENIKSLSKELKSTGNKEKKKEILSKIEKQKLNLVKFKKRNSTYNKYVLRKRKYNYYNLERLLASFLFITRQVIYKNKKFIYEWDKGFFFKITKFNSYNKMQPFYQQVFTKLLYLKASERNLILSERTTFLNSVEKASSFFSESTIEFNTMYPKYLYDKVHNFAKLLSNEAVTEILKAVYNYRKKIELDKDKEDSELIKETSKEFIDSVHERDDYKMNSTIKLMFSSDFVKRMRKKKYRDKLIEWLQKELGEKTEKKVIARVTKILEGYTSKEEVAKNYISKEEVAKNYVTKEEVSNNYVTKEELARVRKELELVKQENKRLIDAKYSRIQHTIKTLKLKKFSLKKE